MKYYLIKIIFCICIVVSINACHIPEHQYIFINDINKNANEVLLNSENKKAELSVKKSIKNSEMAPINLPKKTETVQKLALQKQVKIPNANKFTLKEFINWNEEQLIKTLGKSHFVKEEGILKNYQYHFKECFIDVFLLKKNEVYLVSYVEKRPTKLNGTINIKACLKELSQIMN